MDTLEQEKELYAHFQYVQDFVLHDSSNTIHLQFLYTLTKEELRYTYQWLYFLDAHSNIEREKQHLYSWAMPPFSHEKAEVCFDLVPLGVEDGRSEHRGYNLLREPIVEDKLRSALVCHTWEI